MPAPRVALVGARRSRQGLGPFVARFLRAAGAEVPCFFGTRAESIARAGDELRRLGIAARGYTDAAAMLAEQELDALAILSPSDSHRAWLERALEAGLHVLCEKPLVWGGDDDLAAASELVAAFEARGLLLRENCQWPYTLPAFAALYPEALARSPSRFAMRLSPTVRGAEMLGDSLSHPLSLLQALAPDPGAAPREVRLSTRDPSAEALDLAFRWAGPAADVDVRVELRREESPPRTAGYAVDGCWAWRLVRPSDYALFFACGARVVDLPDPLGSLVTGFVAELARRKAPRERPGGRVAAPAPPEGQLPARDPVGPVLRIVQRLQGLQELRRAWGRDSR